MPLVAAFPAAYLFSENPGSGAGDAAVAAALCAVAAWALWLGLSLLPWGRDGAGLVVSAGAALFLMYGHIEAHVYGELERRSGLFTEWEGPAAEALGGGALAAGLAGAILSEAFVTAAAAAAVVALALAAGARLANPGRIMSAAAAGALLLPLAGLAAHAAEAAAYAGPEPPSRAAFELDPGPEPPDVWYILPDAYSGPEALAGLGIDGSGLARSLEGHGLRTVGSALSNYDATAPTLESLLTMDYSAGGTGTLSFGAKKQRLHNLSNNEVMERFGRMGYETHVVRGGVNYGSESDYAALGADRVHCAFRGVLDSAFLYEFARGTAAGDEMGDALALEKRGKRLCAFEEISRLAAEEGGPPKFVFAYVSMPHGPYIFGPDCEESRHEAGAEARRAAYAAQIECTGLLLERAVGEIMAGSDDPAIIVQADHGGRQSEGEELAEFINRHNILKSYRFPGGAPSPAFEGSTPVNTFRILFDEHFGGRYGLLEDYAVLSCVAPWSPDLGALQIPVRAQECHAAGP